MSKWMTAATTKKLPAYNNMISGWQQQSETRNEKKEVAEIGHLMVDAYTKASQMQPEQRKQYLNQAMTEIHKQFPDRWDKVTTISTVLNDKITKAKREGQQDTLFNQGQENRIYEIGKRGIPEVAYLKGEAIYPQSAKEWLQLKAQGATTQKPLSPEQEAEYNLKMENLNKQGKLYDAKLSNVGQYTPAQIKLQAERSLKNLGAQMSAKGHPLVEGENGELMTTVPVIPDPALDGKMMPDKDTLTLISRGNHSYSMGKARKENGQWVADIYLGGYTGGSQGTPAPQKAQTSENRPPLDQIFSGSASGGMSPDAKSNQNNVPQSGPVAVNDTPIVQDPHRFDDFEFGSKQTRYDRDAFQKALPVLKQQYPNLGLQDLLGVFQRMTFYKQKYPNAPEEAVRKFALDARNK